MGIYIALGANQSARYKGENVSPSETFSLTTIRLQQSGVDVLKASNLWQSPAWPDPDAQAPYVNGVIEVETAHAPAQLLEILKQAEAAFGRTQTVRNAPRPLDLDILDYQGQVLTSKTLTLPHPRMLGRPFVLFPLAEIAPAWRDPIKKRTIQNWTARLSLKDVAPLKRFGKML